jgi:5S rRNA maturation endonuclease (ribonuclease M5)
MVNHLESRDIDFALHKPIVNNDSATFMCYNLSGQLVGWQRYAPNRKSMCSNNPDGRYYSYRIKHHISIFGLETYRLDAKCVFITEGIFDTARLTKRGMTAFALLTNSPNSSMINFLECIPQRKVVICDNDKGGDFLRKSLKYSTKDFIVPNRKDLGEESVEFVENIIKTYNV